ncbi:molecular chaperone [Stenotrophomonas maltophilia]|uniref:fimbrial biogenesis chaperone n=1 Tax=Stenotrophomonas maltophilia TaxID=40324 RepID=UPI001312083C
MLRFRYSLMKAGLAAALSSAALSASAGVVITGTRVVFPAEQREVSVRLQNTGDTPSLVQAWIDDGKKSNEVPGESTVPFVIRPPIFRMDGGRSQLLRISHTGESMPADRESVYFLNVLAVPGKRAENAGSAELNLVVRTRMKLFYRPKALSAAGAAKAAAQLQWSVSEDASGWVLNATNPTPYYVSVNAIEAGGLIRADVAAPLATTPYRLSQSQYRALGAQLKFSYITDHGAKVEQVSPLNRS